MQRPTPLVVGEIFHIYNRGANKMTFFESDTDYVRFLHLLFLCNQAQPVHLGSLTKKERGPSSFYLEERGDPLVHVLAYCLMPNHFHLVLRGCSEGALSKFMKKLGTGYSMYFNTSRERTGTLFQGRFKSKHVDVDRYLSHIFSYVHLNPVELYYPSWQKNVNAQKEQITACALEYSYSSCGDYFGRDRPEGSIIFKDKTLSWADTIKKPDDMLNFWAE